MSKSKGMIWPYSIGASIILVFGFCVATIVVTSKMPVEKSDTYMMAYQEADANANELIKARIAFDAKYKLEYITEAISASGTTLKYKVTDIDNKPVNDAKIKAIITRPNNHKHDQELLNPVIENGVYTFSTVTLPKEGRWDIMAKVNVGDLQRFYNFKTDTRENVVVEY